MLSVQDDPGDVAAATRATETSTATLTAGTVVGPWRVEYELGRGGMGTVYAVVHEVIGKRAAMKVIHQHMFTPAYTAERFVLEARAVNVVTHPNIVDIFEAGTLDDGRPYLIMERLRGRTLGERLDEGRLPPLEAIDYLLSLCDALSAAHRAGVVHRDIKLDNVFLVDRQGTVALNEGHGSIVKLLDWGIASVASVDGDRSFRDMLVGTPRYVAPEQARGEPATPASDVYSLGVVAYELFLEAPPFTAESPAEVLAMHLTEPPPPPRDVWPQIPSALEALLMDMLAKSAALRPTIDQVATVLAAVRQELAARRISGPLTALRDPTPVPREMLEHGPTLLSDDSLALPPARRRPWLLASAVCALVAFGAGARLVIGGGATLSTPAAEAAPAPAPTPTPPPAVDTAAADASAPAEVVPGASGVTEPVAPATSVRRAVRTVRSKPAPAARASTRATQSSLTRPVRASRLHPDDVLDPY